MNKTYVLTPKTFLPGLSMQMMIKFTKQKEHLVEVKEVRGLRLLGMTKVSWIRWHLKWMGYLQEGENTPLKLGGERAECAGEQHQCG